MLTLGELLCSYASDKHESMNIQLLQYGHTQEVEGNSMKLLNLRQELHAVR